MVCFPRKHRARWWLTAWVSWAMLWLSTGCQVFSLTAYQPVTDEEPVPTAELETLLSKAQWVSDREWQPLSFTATKQSTPTHGPVRWKLVIPKPPSPKPGETVPAAPPNQELELLEQRYAHLLASDAKLIAEQVDHQALQLLSQKKGDARWTAAILLSRLSEQPESTIPLHELICDLYAADNKETVKIPVAQQSAAIETWCNALAELNGNPEENFAPAGRVLQLQTLPAEVQGELFRGIAQKIAPRQIPGLNEVMVACESERKASPLHLAALEACVLHAWQDSAAATKNTAFQAETWPDGMVACRFSEDVTLRKLYGRWAALSEHPDVLAILRSQRMDNDLNVREMAVVNLGLLSREKAREDLLTVMTKATDPERVAATNCLARLGIDEIIPFAHDESPRVRAAVAKGLGAYPSKVAALTLSDMLTDLHVDVQLAALEACRQPQWVDYGQASLLLQALRDGSMRTRQLALSQLRQNWGKEPVFPLDGTVEEREVSVRKLAHEHQVSAEVYTVFESREKSLLQKPKDQTTPKLDSPPDDVRLLVQSYLQQPVDQPTNSELLGRLQKLDSSAVSIIEQTLGRDSGLRTEQIYRDVLPLLHPAYEALKTLESPDAIKRREAGHRLREQADRGSLPPHVLRRISQKMAVEQDRQVWQEVMASILPDAHAEAAQIALIALNSTWPDIRQLGCDYFERHPHPEYTAWVLPRLQDADQQIQLRAIRILSRCGNPAALDGYQDQESFGLRQFLMDSNPQIRWEALRAMSQLGDAQASQELIRQSYDSRPKQREQAIATMGQTGQARFVDPLVRLSWTESDRSVQVALLRALDQLVPANDRPGLAPDSSISDKIKEWGRWWEQRQRMSAASASAGLVPNEFPR